MSRNLYLILALVIWTFALANPLSAEDTIDTKKTDTEKTKTSKVEEKNKDRVDVKKGKWLAQWGYNRSYYTPSDISFRGPGYKFTLEKVRASDDPEKLNKSYIQPSTIPVSQYNLRITRYLTDNLFLAFGEDHMKYVMSNNQPVRMFGYIDQYVVQRASYTPSLTSLPYLYFYPNNLDQFTGYHGGETVTVTPDFLEFEHTDGLNYFFLEIGYSFNIWVSKQAEHALSMVSSVGAGFVVLRTDARIFGEGKNTNFHLAGYGVAFYTALRFEFFKRFFIEGGFKAGYIDLSDILVTGRSKERASQRIGYLEKMVYLGYTFR